MNSVCRSLAASLVALLALPAAAQSAQTLGSDLAGTPTIPCQAAFDCTVTSTALRAPAAGVITQVTVKHGVNPGVGIPAFGVRVLSPGTSGSSFTTILGPFGGVQSMSSASGTETLRFSDDYGRPRGVPIAAGQQLGIYWSEAVVPVFAAGGGGAEATGNHHAGEQAYADRGAQLLVQATLEPDADGDGYGDESQRAGSGGGDHDRGSGGSGGTGGDDIQVFVAGSIEAFRAQTPRIYRAASIKRLPSRVNLHDAIMKGFTTPVRCSVACQIQAYASIRAISGSLFDFAAWGARATAARRVPQPRLLAASRGRFETAGVGTLRIELNRGARRQLRRASGPVSVHVRIGVLDRRGALRQRNQVVTLVP